jgi:hypothetical protein
VPFFTNLLPKLTPTFSHDSLILGSLLLRALLHHIGSLYVEAGQDKEHLLNIESLGHAALVFVNKRFVGRFASGYLT